MKRQELEMIYRKQLATKVIDCETDEKDFNKACIIVMALLSDLPDEDVDKVIDTAKNFIEAHNH